MLTSCGRFNPKVLETLVGQCTAKAHTTGVQCRRAAMHGGNVCMMHGGKAPQTMKKAAQRYAEAADKSLTRLTGYVDEGIVEPKVLLDASVKLREMAETLAGRVARREEVVSVNTSELDAEIGRLLEDMAGGEEAGAAGSFARAAREASDSLEPPSAD